MKRMKEEAQPQSVIAALTDFHSHFLPEIDDGSQSVEESLGMLAEMKQQGVRRVVATPHFYPWNMAPEDFLARRESAFQKLKAQLPDDAPEILLGAEVAFYSGIGHSAQATQFCITGTRCCLVEMPFVPWKPEMLDELSQLSDRYGVTPIIAHLERYDEASNKRTWQELCKRGFFIQCNATAFVEKPTHILRKMLEEGAVSLLGTDSHNLTTRKPNLYDAVTYLAENGYSEALYTFIDRGDMILPPLS